MGGGGVEMEVVRKEKLVGFKNFKRVNPMTDRFDTRCFHHIEYYCGDANTTWRRFSVGLGMQLVAKSDLSTGNTEYASYVLKSRSMRFVITAPYGPLPDGVESDLGKVPLPSFDREGAHDFLRKHGLGVKAVGLLVGDAAEAYRQATSHGAVGISAPASRQGTSFAEVQLYPKSDVVLRFISGDVPDAGLPGYEPVDSEPICYGLERLDHVVGNVHDMLDTYNYLIGMTGFHEFAEFTAEDVGTVDSGLNSIVAASNNEMILLPINEPTYGTKRKSQIQTYLEQNGGPGVQHLALKTDDIFVVVREMRKHSALAGFEFMPRASAKYYAGLRDKIGDTLTPEQYKECEELGILVDKDDQGTLLQLFTKPLGDRPTLFLEVIQRVGCLRKVEQRVTQAAGCGGFGKGNFKELFKSVEEFETTLNV